ncbi:MAG TPA: hypothetical protein VJ652_16340 [Noviherbaspirillum sp.]|nr:hypothetical protein [Noviherbaspirillum sp.]
MCNFTITAQAAPQILQAAHDANAESMFLRVTGRRADNGAVVHGMGFDELRTDDLQLESRGVRIVITPSQARMLDGAILDFVELSTGHKRFVFINPNDDGCTVRLGGCGYCAVQCRPAVACP